LLVIFFVAICCPNRSQCQRSQRRRSVVGPQVPVVFFDHGQLVPPQLRHRQQVKPARHQVGDDAVTHGIGGHDGRSQRRSPPPLPAFFHESLSHALPSVRASSRCGRGLALALRIEEFGGHRRQLDLAITTGLVFADCEYAIALVEAGHRQLCNPPAVSAPATNPSTVWQRRGGPCRSMPAVAHDRGRHLACRRRS